eukprot:TRINITY_DN12904_c0_g1_i1.p1 TRINITY_DN12904_c0_g1~~TRINITY_DN12904_c0_g1_i1.p1  ORF type:complete len:196 (-),score=26.01 TRINITY_DN12904_c0_g1_i1:50-577(-)
MHPPRPACQEPNILPKAKIVVDAYTLPDPICQERAILLPTKTEPSVRLQELCLGPFNVMNAFWTTFAAEWNSLDDDCHAKVLQVSEGGVDLGNDRQIRGQAQNGTHHFGIGFRNCEKNEEFKAFRCLKKALEIHFFEDLQTTQFWVQYIIEDCLYRGPMGISYLDDGVVEYIMNS